MFTRGGRPLVVVLLALVACTAKLREPAKQNLRSGASPEPATTTAISTPPPPAPTAPEAVAAQPVVALAGLPEEDADAAPLAVTVGGDGVASYRHVLAKGATCAGATLGDWRDVAAPITDTPAGAGAHTLCVEGRSADAARVSERVAVVFHVPGYVALTPASVTPRGETAVEVSWTLPAGVTPVRYDLHAAADPATADTALPKVGTEPDATKTSALVTGLTPGTRGKVLVKARVRSDTAVAQDAASARYWTPYGALNQESVSAVRWDVGGAAASAGPMAVSAKLSLFYTGVDALHTAAAYAGVPQAPLETPAYNFLSTAIGPDASGFAYGTADLTALWTNGTDKVAVAVGSGGHRVLLYDHLPLTPGTRAPDRALGQSDLTGISANAGGAASASTLSAPGGVCFNGTTFYVADTANNRILGWADWPSDPGQPADFVLGQADMTSTSANRGNPAPSLLTLSGPTALACRGGKLVVADGGNHRVLVWSPAPKAAAAAALVLGQTGGTGKDPDGAAGVSEGGLQSPGGVALVPNGNGGYALLVADTGHARLVQWTSFPTANGQRFDKVYGQPDRTTVTAPAAPAADALTAPMHLANELDEAGTPTSAFWVADGGGPGRHLRWTLNAAAASLVRDEQDLTADATWSTLSQSATHTGGGWRLRTDRVGLGYDPGGGVMAVGDLLWTEPPTSGATAGAKGFGTGVALAGGRLYWTSGERILSQPVSDTPAPDIAIGRKNVDGTDDAGTPDDWAHKIAPTALAVSDGKLYALDGPRVVVWNAPPTTSHPTIDVVIGQDVVDSRTPNKGGVTLATLGDHCAAMLIAGGRLYVADTENDRVLIWNAVPTVTGAAADVELTGLSKPSGLALLNGKLVVADTDNGRLAIWNAPPTVSATPPDRTYDVSAERYALPSWFDARYLRPYELAAHDGTLYVALQDRVLVLPDLWD